MAITVVENENDVYIDYSENGDLFEPVKALEDSGFIATQTENSLSTREIFHKKWFSLWDRPFIFSCGLFFESLYKNHFIDRQRSNLKLFKLHNAELIRELENLDKGPQSRLPGKKHFIESQRSKIARTITVVGPILDGLLLRTVLEPKQYNYIQSHSTNQKKMLALYSFVKDWSESDKDIMYALLKQHNGELIRKLENQDKGPPSLLLDKNHFIDRQQSNLLRKVTQVNPILDGLLLHTQLTLGQYDDIQSKITNREKMQALYNIVEDWSEVEKDTVYELLKLHNAELIRELENLDKGLPPQLQEENHFINRQCFSVKNNSLNPILDCLSKHDYIESKTTNQEKMEAPHSFVYGDFMENVRDVLYHALKRLNVKLRQEENQVTTIYSQPKMNLPGVNKAMGTFSNSLGTFFISYFFCALLAGFPAASCESHRLWYSQTGILQAGKNPSEFEFQTAGFVDDQQIDKYTHLTRRDKPVAAWMAKNEDEEYWQKETISRIGWEKVFKDNLQILWHRVNDTSMPVTLQHFYGCELGEDGSLRGYYHYGLNGRDFLYLDEQTMMWNPCMHEAQISAERWNRDPSIALDVRNYLVNRCPEALKKYIDFIKKDPPNKTVPPGVKVWGRKTEVETKLHCLVYGFYPRAVDVKWVKNGVDHILSHQMSPILPHPDGTYQIRVDVEVPTNEEDSYSCLVDHNSLEEPISVIWDPTTQETNRNRILLLLGSTTALIFIISLIFVIRYQRSRTDIHHRNKMKFNTSKNGMDFNI